jgi:PAS domain S-box-containing protein
MYIYIKNDKEFIDIFKNAKDSDEKDRAIIRKKLKKKASLIYKYMLAKGVLQFHFFLPDNTSFLRMHKPEKFGDNLGDIRYSVANTNKTHKITIGFEQGRVAHGFRNIFPLFDGDNYLGCCEISFSSESMQHRLKDINKLHSHFLINKDTFNNKAWNKSSLLLNYIQSIENKNYLFAILKGSVHNLLDKKQKELIEPHKHYISKNMSISRKFSFYQQTDDGVKIVSFLPIRNIRDTKTVAYLVSYSQSPFIESILTTYILINTLSFIALAIILILTYRQLLHKKQLQKQTQEQAQLLSLFNKGEITLFKWKNDEVWSVEYVSNNVKNLTGYDKTEFMDNTISYSTVIDQNHLQRVINEVTEAMDKEMGFFKHDPYKIITKDKQTKWIHDITTIIRDKENNITHFLGYIIDITEMKMLELEVQELNKNLNLEVVKQTSENLKKDKLLQEQSKLAAMGEMVGSIAHQWRQPLNSLNINIQNLDDDYIDGLIDQKFLEEFIQKQTKTIKFMSQTIDDFRNFFRIDKIEKTFSVKDAIDSTISIQSAQLKNHNISIGISGDDFTTHTIESEFLQVILNIITNAKDAIIQNNIEYGKIEIVLNREKKSIKISDNAGGIPNDILDRIFEPYFTTKEQGKGTGIGLYMSKVIIEQNIGGSLSAKNIKDGAEFTIKID